MPKTPQYGAFRVFKILFFSFTFQVSGFIPLRLTWNLKLET